jgi:peptidoglycan pentaglycine glycine transferase (the first glycine)
VEITMSADPADIEKFWPVYQATVERQHFTPFGKEGLKKELELFAKDGEVAFFFGTYQGEIIAAAIIIFYNGQAFYHHSGSIQRSKEINASYLLQWRVIQEAKRRGCTLYNFWGISPDDKPAHPWAGLSLFKKGFGGFAEEYLHAQDKPLSAKYALNYVIETGRRIKRGL